MTRTVATLDISDWASCNEHVMKDQLPPRLLPLIAFSALYMIAAVAGAMVQGNKEFVFYIVVMLVLIGVVTLVHRAVTLTGALLWALSIWGLLHMAGGLVPLPQGWPFNGGRRYITSLRMPMGFAP
jgi:uncharacterized membrane protein